MFENTPENPQPNCILGLDVGDRRVGVSIGYVESSLATPIGAYDRGGGLAERNIISLVKDKRVNLILVGMPFGDQGQISEQCRKIAKFCRRLRNRISAKIGYIDEYATSLQAKELLSDTKSSRIRKKLGKGAVDAISAMLIVESYLSNKHYIELESLDPSLQEVVNERYSEE